MASTFPGAARRTAPLAGLLLLLSGCGMFFGASEPPPLPGERESVLGLTRTLTADPELASVPVKLPRPFVNPEWPQAGGYANHAMYHLALGGTLSQAWDEDIGESADSERRLLAEPVSAGGRVFTMDADSTVTAFNLADGTRLWETDVTPEDEDDDPFGGGIAVDGDKLYVSTAFAKLFALDAATGNKLWEAPLPAPSRTPPAVSGGRVFVITIDNELVTLAAADGRKLWSHSGLSETAGLLGGATPAVRGTVAVVSYTSGELYALQVETGRVLWSDQLGGAGTAEGLASLADIRGRPVIDRDLVLAMNYSGTLAAIDLRSGSRVWDASIGGTQSPWVGGDFVYVVSDDGQLFCLSRDAGRIRWIRQLPLYEDEEAHEGRILWSGPVLAGDRLVLTGSNGEALAVSPYTGKVLGRQDLDAESELPPVVVDNTLLMLTNDARLAAFR